MGAGQLDLHTAVFLPPAIVGLLTRSKLTHNFCEAKIPRTHFLATPTFCPIFCTLE